jgi:uncharacterized protein (DUF433 family)
MTGQNPPWAGIHDAWKAADSDDSVWKSAPCAAFLTPPEEQYNVSRKPSVWAGAAVIAGSAIPVFMVEDLYNEEQRVETVLEAYPWLRRDEILRALAYAEAYKETVAEDRERHERAIREAFGH